MTNHRVPAPDLSGEKPKGPASYFPSIEQTYGRPIQEWLDIAAERLDTAKHMEVVESMKADFSLGHGHANAIVGYAKAVLAS